MASSGRITTPYAAAHLHPQGINDARPTAMQIIRDQGLIDSLADKVFLVTGANDTTGLETARALHMTGGKVIITTRSEEKSAKAIKSIFESNGGEKGGVEAVTMDLADLDDVRRAAGKVLEKCGGRLNVLVCNAGMMPDSASYTKAGHEINFGVNHLGHLLLIHLLKSTLLASSSPSFASRLILVSSIGHRASPVHYSDIHFHHRPWTRETAYGQSKTAMIHSANYIDRIYGPQGLHAWSLQPGGIDSNLWVRNEEMRTAVRADPAWGPFLKSPAQGAATQVWAAVGRELEGKGGRYLESMQEIGPWMGPEVERLDWTVPGFEGYIYDKELQDRTWKVSCEMLGLESD